VNKLALAAVLLAAPLAARADIGLRLGAEAGILHHSDAGTSVITDNWPLAANVMLSYWLPGSFLSIDGELTESFTLSPATRTGTGFRAGITVSPPVLPIYLRAAIPLHFEPSPFTTGLRVGAGLTANILVLKIYLEADADFPLFGASGAPSAFGTQDVSLGAGVEFKF
jgi:hypothetical protein